MIVYVCVFICVSMMNGKVHSCEIGINQFIATVAYADPEIANPE